MDEFTEAETPGWEGQTEMVRTAAQLRGYPSTQRRNLHFSKPSEQVQEPITLAGSIAGQVQTGLLTYLRRARSEGSRKSADEVYDMAS